MIRVATDTGHGVSWVVAVSRRCFVPRWRAIQLTETRTADAVQIVFRLPHFFRRPPIEVALLIHTLDEDAHRRILFQVMLLSFQNRVEPAN